MPSTEPTLSPADVAGSGLCIGCGSCAAQAGPERVAMKLDRYGQLKPSGSGAWRGRGSPALARTCPFSPAARDEDALSQGLFPAAPHRDPWIGRFETAYVGHAEEGAFRAAGSSGGMTTWVAAELLRRGLVNGVAHVAASPGEPFFRYTISRSEADLRAGAKSRYYPIELSEVIRAIRTTPGRYAVVGIPCFIKAVHLLRAEEPVLRERIAFTLGLFCGHMKSARMVESFAWQMGTTAQAVAGIDFRVKDPSRPANWYAARIALKGGGERRRDWWHMVDGDWGAGFFQNSACNFCDDVTAETADISFGDAWLEPYSSDGRGTNVVVVRSPVIAHLVRTAIEAGRLRLEEVDADFVYRTQAAGFRQRREGLAFRLSRRRPGLAPRKRVAGAPNLPARRKLIYLMRAAISAWSHRVFFLARLFEAPRIYTGWARTALAAYQGFAYSRGRFGALVDRVQGAARTGGD